MRFAVLYSRGAFNILLRYDCGGGQTTNCNDGFFRLGRRRVLYPALEICASITAYSRKRGRALSVRGFASFRVFMANF